ncbi:autotransporter assembly complex protein TamA [Chitinimonas taiwanensis]|uniref:Translocation and assembly module subunit TamA n=1 Tax=Chitinimonas taiwanensis DSM 18899 TaxID=1121279 RepID=A0A1K2HM61_9NEIS|nr:autotransporter assembly complex family protein [Chitinimonas taiwanensis]SFZ77855.1 autotransporter secretion outer membrane protein TamA [Chitinimonas taiwanensis DSM 18899]
MTTRRGLATLPAVHRSYVLPLCYLLPLCLAVPGYAAGVDYDVRIDAPSAIEKLLEDNLGILRWRGNDYIDQEQLSRLYEATPAEIEKLLGPLGYFKPRIESSLQPDGKGWLARFKVEPGAEALIFDVDLQVAGAIRDEPDFRPRWAELIEVWPLPIGAPFTQSDWDSAKRRGLQALIIDRFPAAKIRESRAEIDPERPSAELSVLFDSGPRFTFGELQINGLNKYPRKLVERMVTFRPGEGYSQQKLLDFQTELQNTPYFSSVFMDMPLDPAQPADVPVRVELVEAPARKTDIGLGFDTDKGPRGSLAYRYTNLRRLGWIGSTGLDLQKEEQSFNLGVELPPDEKRYRYSSAYKVEHSDVSGLDSWTHTFGVQRTRLRGEIEVTQALQYTRETTRRMTSDGEEKNRARALIPSQSWTQRDLDNLNDPQRGTVMSWQLAGATRAALSDTDFLRAWGRIAWYHPAGERGLWLLRGEAGQVLAEDSADVPTKWLFRAGGANSVRGYKYQSLGVQDEGAVLGGRVLATASAEYQHKIVDRWRAAVFADFGGAALDWTNFKAYRGYGLGARWISPVGPFALDLARGVEARRTRIHFSLGVGF